MRVRAVLGGVACLPVLSAALAPAAESVGRSLVPPVFLPDGSEFTTWEQPFR
jgi:hypothetical protein